MPHARQRQLAPSQAYGLLVLDCDIPCCSTGWCWCAQPFAAQSGEAPTSAEYDAPHLLCAELMYRNPAPVVRQASRVPAQKNKVAPGHVCAQAGELLLTVTVSLCAHCCMWRLYLCVREDTAA